jgi:Icc-related predicted phosphoesterase
MKNVYKGKIMKIYIFSDSHCRHKELNIPEVDMAIFCGDMSNSFNYIDNTIQCLDFLGWYSSLPIKNKLLIVGNHDRAIEYKWILPSDYPKLNWFFNETKVIEGLKIFGSPYTPVYGNWSYGYNRKDAHRYWNCIEEDTNIVFTHGPGKGILDLAEDMEDRNRIVQAGCKTLYDKIMKIKPKYHMFGHLHSTHRFNNRGIYNNGVTTFINASCLNHSNNVLYDGFVVDL